jgi:hypothetical protein
MLQIIRELAVTGEKMVQNDRSRDYEEQFDSSSGEENDSDDNNLSQTAFSSPDNTSDFNKSISKRQKVANQIKKQKIKELKRLDQKGVRVDRDEIVAKSMLTSQISGFDMR